MRRCIVPEGVKHLEYEIRQIVEDAYRLRELGVAMTWENIGDPVAMGEAPADWIVEIVRELLDENRSWAYSPTSGVVEAREFLAAGVNARGGVQISPEDILFVNGIADAVDKIYDLVHKDNRIIMPSPCYSTHSSNEGKRGDYDPVTFRLDPRNGWAPDLEELRLKVRYNPQVVAIAFVHPDNPTGICYRREWLEEIVAVAREYGLFIICDEIYAHICYNGASTLHLSEVLGDVPAMSLRGISKEYPWPGSRCGWIEFLNRRRDPHFEEYARAILLSKMMEVCSTTLPQMSIPRVMGDARYAGHLAARAERFAARAEETYAAFSDIEGVIVNRTQGAFYFTVVFEDGVLSDRQTLPIANPDVRGLVEDLTREVAPDKRFVYYLMGSEGICVTPLSGFQTGLLGFRITYLQNDDAKRRETLGRLAGAVRSYLAS